MTKKLKETAIDRLKYLGVYDVEKKGEKNYGLLQRYKTCNYLKRH